MAVKTHLSQQDFVSILSQYELGAFVHAAALPQGTVQSNYRLQTTSGTFVLRYYENRSMESVLFESHLLAYLTQHAYPSPPQIKNRQGAYVGRYRERPYVLFVFLEGQPVEHPSKAQWRQLVQKAAQLQQLTAGYHSPYTRYRWNYDPALCSALAQAAAERIDTPRARAKLAWLTQELAGLDLPASLPKGICHCDFHFSNVLYAGEQLVAVLDFDDANYTFLAFDLVGLIEQRAWPHPRLALDLPAARSVVALYTQQRRLAPIEQQHLYDVYRLSILFDCVWYFERWSGDDFYERLKLEALNALGRQRFFDVLCAGM